MSDVVRYEADGQVAVVTLDDGKRNALSVEVLEAVHAAFDRAEADGAAVLLTGREGCFTAGFDLKVFGRGGEELLRMLELGATLSERILGFPRPVVIGAPGHAMAAGAFFLLAADVRIGADGPFKVGLNETAIGLWLPYFVPALARFRLTPAHRDEAVVQARVYTPAEAVAPGYLDRVVDPAAVAAEALEAARGLADLDAAAYAANKARLREPVVADVRAGVERMLEEFATAR